MPAPTLASWARLFLSREHGWIRGARGGPSNKRAVAGTVTLYMADVGVTWVWLIISAFYKKSRWIFAIVTGSLASQTLFPRVGGHGRKCGGEKGSGVSGP